jgi:hypothetical protein
LREPPKNLLGNFDHYSAQSFYMKTKVMIIFCSLCCFCQIYPLYL